MTKEKTARLIPNAIQVCTDNEKVRDTDTQIQAFIWEEGYNLILQTCLRLNCEYVIWLYLPKKTTGRPSGTMSVWEIGYSIFIANNGGMFLSQTVDERMVGKILTDAACPELT